MCLCMCSMPVNTEHTIRCSYNIHKAGKKLQMQPQWPRVCWYALLTSCFWADTRGGEGFAADHIRLSAEQAMTMATWQLGERSQLGSISKRYWQAKERWRSLAMLHISDHTTHLKDKRNWATVLRTVLMTNNFQIPAAIDGRVLITKFEKDAGRERDLLPDFWFAEELSICSNC